VSPPPKRHVVVPYENTTVENTTVETPQQSIVGDSPVTKDNQLQESASAWRKVLTYSNASTPGGIKVKSRQRRRISSGAKPAARRKSTKTKKGTSGNNPPACVDQKHSGAAANQELFALTKRFHASFEHLK
jgi:hypothetical protein